MYEYVKTHDFKQSHKIEEEGFERQDRFYLEHFGSLPTRIQWEEDSGFQCSDRDLLIEYGGRTLSVSEKNRTRDYNDTLFEIFSNYYQCVLGWAMHSTADLLCYFLPSSVMVVDMQSVVGILSDPENKMAKQVECYTETCRCKDIWINGQPHNIPVIRAQNNGYSSVSIALSDGLLTKLGVRFKRF